MSSLGKYISDKELTTYDLVALKLSLVKKPTHIISKGGILVEFGDIGYSIELSLQNFEGKEITRKPEGVRPYVVHFQNLDALNVGYLKRSGNLIIRYFFLESGTTRKAEHLIHKFEKLAKSYKLKPFMITLDRADNAMNVHIPLNPKSIELLTKLEEELEVRDKT